MSAKLSVTPRYRAAVAGRAFLAIVVNYALTAIVTALLARHLPLVRVEAVAAATLSSFLIFAIIAMAIFYARSTARAWAWMIGATTVLGGLLALSIRVGGMS